MRILLMLLTSIAWIVVPQQSPSPWSFDKTMRVDYFHTGGPKSGETVSLDRVVNDGAWPGLQYGALDRRAIQAGD